MKHRTRVEGIMDRQARGYTDQQLRVIADYFASLPGGGD
jgi:cytochrome c553